MSSHTWGLIGLIVLSPVVALNGVWYVVTTVRAGRDAD